MTKPIAPWKKRWRRTQIYIEKSQHAALKRRAKKRKTINSGGISEIIREAVQDYLERTSE